MATKRARVCKDDAKMKSLSAPPGFISLTSFTLKRIAEGEGSNGMASANAMQMNATSDASEVDALRATYGRRPWILFDQSNEIPEEDYAELQEARLPLSSKLSKGVRRGCPDCSDCLKVTARWRPQDSVRDLLEEAPTFTPSDEEFEDVLKYIAGIRPQAEHSGICRIIPPASWKPPEASSEEEDYKFVSTIQRVDSLQTLSQYKRDSILGNVKAKRRRGLDVILNSRTDALRDPEIEGGLRFQPGPEFTLKSFKRFADDFKGQYFGYDGPATNLSQVPLEPSVEDIEGEYGRITQNPTEEIEVLYGNNLERRSAWNNCSETGKNYVWNFHKLPRYHGSLLSFENSGSNVLVPKLHVGMCFASHTWKVEEQHLYSLVYLHLGSPKVWYGIPVNYSMKYQTARNSYLADLSPVHGELVVQLSPSDLKSEGVPVYRCVQHPGELVLVFPGAYHSAFSCGFNCSESVNFAPIDWICHGQHAIELYSLERKRTSISFDKLLLGAAREAVREMWETTLRGKNASANLTWKNACGKDGLLTVALRSHIKNETLKRKYLSIFESQRMERDFDAACKRECSFCMYDLHASAVRCRCSLNKYSCLLHGKQLCSCPRSEKVHLFRYEIKELNVLLEALGGKLSAIYKWAKEDLGLTLSPAASERCLQTPSMDCQTARAKESKEGPSSNGLNFRRDVITTSTVRTESKARLLQSKASDELRTKHNVLETEIKGNTVNTRCDSVSNINAKTKETLPASLSSELKGKQQAGRSPLSGTFSGIGNIIASGVKFSMKPKPLKSQILDKAKPKPVASTDLGGNMLLEISSDESSDSEDAAAPDSSLGKM